MVVLVNVPPGELNEVCIGACEQPVLGVLVLDLSLSVFQSESSFCGKQFKLMLLDLVELLLDILGCILNRVVWHVGMRVCVRV